VQKLDAKLEKKAGCRAQISSRDRKLFYEIHFWGGFHKIRAHGVKNKIWGKMQ
jgi:hypothetical protein